MRGSGQSIRGADSEDDDFSKTTFKSKHTSRSRSRSPPLQRHPGKRIQQEESQDRSRATRNHTPPRHSKLASSRSDLNETRKPRSPSPKKQNSYHRQHNPGITKKLSAEELERKRREMMDNAKWREEERASNVQKYKQEEEKEKERDKKDSRDGKFIHHMKLESASSSSLEDRVKRNIHSIQRTPAALEKNFMKR